MLGVSLFGVDGQEWNLRNGPVQLTVAGIEGFAHLAPSYQTAETAAEHGQRTTSWKYGKRPVTLPVKWNMRYMVDVEGVQRQFWDSLMSDDVNQQCRIQVTDGSGATRSLTVRFADETSRVTLDPYVAQMPFTISFVADDPWWYGPSVPVVFPINVDLAPVNFFGGGDASAQGFGPPFFITEATGSDGTNVSNVGNSPSWAKWTIEGKGTDGASSFRLGVDGHYLSSEIRIPPNSKLVISTDPLNQYALLNGVNVNRYLTEVDFAPIPPGKTVPVTIEITGQALVYTDIAPRYRRAY